MKSALSLSSEIVFCRKGYECCAEASTASDIGHLFVVSGYDTGTEMVFSVSCLSTSGLPLARNLPAFISVLLCFMYFVERVEHFP